MDDEARRARIEELRNQQWAARDALSRARDGLSRSRETLAKARERYNEVANAAAEHSFKQHPFDIGSAKDRVQEAKTRAHQTNYRLREVEGMDDPDPSLLATARRQAQDADAAYAKAQGDLARMERQTQEWQERHREEQQAYRGKLTHLNANVESAEAGVRRSEAKVAQHEHKLAEIGQKLSALGA